jgi:hypothetical protein
MNFGVRKAALNPANLDIEKNPFGRHDSQSADRVIEAVATRISAQHIANAVWGQVREHGQKRSVCCDGYLWLDPDNHAAIGSWAPFSVGAVAALRDFDIDLAVQTRIVTSPMCRGRACLRRHHAGHLQPLPPLPCLTGAGRCNDADDLLSFVTPDDLKLGRVATLSVPPNLKVLCPTRRHWRKILSRGPYCRLTTDALCSRDRSGQSHAAEHVAAT